MWQKMEQKWDRKEFNLAPPPKIVYSLLVFEYQKSIGGMGNGKKSGNCRVTGKGKDN